MLELQPVETRFHNREQQRDARSGVVKSDSVRSGAPVSLSQHPEIFVSDVQESRVSLLKQTAETAYRAALSRNTHLPSSAIAGTIHA